MKYAIWAFILFSLAGCRGDIVDVSQLNLTDQLLFAEAAAREGVSVTNHGQLWDWSVEYDYGMEEYVGFSQYSYSYNNPDCNIRINPNNLSICKPGGIDQHFKMVSRHELKHCNGYDHSQNPQNLMYEYPPCWPVD